MQKKQNEQNDDLFLLKPLQSFGKTIFESMFLEPTPLHDEYCAMWILKNVAMAHRNGKVGLTGKMAKNPEHAEEQWTQEQ